MLTSIFARFRFIEFRWNRCVVHILSQNKMINVYLLAHYFVIYFCFTFILVSFFLLYLIDPCENITYKLLYYHTLMIIR